MISWNYRIIKDKDARGEDFYGIYEVYYDKDEDMGEVKLSWTQEPADLVGESLKGILEDMLLMGQAFDRPILDMKELQGHYSGDLLNGIDIDRLDKSDGKVTIEDVTQHDNSKE